MSIVQWETGLRELKPIKKNDNNSDKKQDNNKPNNSKKKWFLYNFYYWIVKFYLFIYAKLIQYQNWW